MSAAGTDIQATLINCFCAARGRLHPGRGRRGLPRHLRSPARGGRNHAPRRRRGLRLLAHPPARRRGQGHRTPWPRGRAATSTCSTSPAPRSRAPGRRRGAQMGVLRIDHPDVLDFITAKRTPGRWNNFNVSVGVSDTFMQARGDDQPWELVHRAAGRQPDRAGRLPARDGLWVYQTMCRARAVGHHHEVGLRLRRAGHPVPGPHQPRQQPATTARPLRPPTPAASNRCRPTAAATWGRSS
jgi:ribonucleoside-diphosphate reductase alpha chain